MYFPYLHPIRREQPRDCCPPNLRKIDASADICCATWEAQEKRTEALEKFWRTVTPEIVRDFICPYLLRFCFTV